MRVEVSSGRAAPEHDHLNNYLVTATVARSATESAGPALLVSSIAILGSAASGSYIVACLTVSAAVAGPIIGAIIDRSDRPARAFRIAMAIMAVGLTCFALFLAHMPLAFALLLAFLTGLGYPAITGAWSAQLPHLVPDRRLKLAYSRDAATYSLAAVVAPPIATALVALAVTAPLWMPVGLLIVAIVTLRWVPLKSNAARAERPTITGNLRAGLGAMGRIPALRRTVIITTIGFAGTASIFVAAPLISQKMTNDLAFTGVILAAFAIGGLISAAAVAKFTIHRADRAVIGFTILSGLALLLVGLAPTPLLVVIAAFVMGMTEPPLVSGMFQVRARESHGSVRAQVFTTSASLRMTAFALATAACGALVAWGIWAIIIFGVLLHLVGLVAGLIAGPPIPARHSWLKREASS